jgi:flagellar M-ring protein FliF
MRAMAVAARPGAVAGPSALGLDMFAADQGATPPTLPGWMKDARNLGAAQAQTLKTVGTLVEENPKQAALIVRDWLSSAV